MSTAKLQEWVVSDPAILDGLPVIKGTRIPVHDVAASWRAGHPIGQILAAYPRLCDDDVHRAALYAERNPLRRRPSVAPRPPLGAITREDRTVPFKNVKSGAGPGSGKARSS